MSVLNDRQAPATANRKPVRGTTSCCRHSRLEKCVCERTRATTEKRASKLKAAATVADIFSCGKCSDIDRSRIVRAVRVVRKTSDKNPRQQSKMRHRQMMPSCHDISSARFDRLLRRPERSQLDVILVDRRWSIIGLCRRYLVIV